MKKHSLFLNALLIFATFFSVAFSCEDDDPEVTLNDQQLTTQELTGTWVVDSFTTPQGIDTDYSNLEITITGDVNDDDGGGSFSTTNGEPLFATSGSWEFVGNSTVNIDFVQTAEADIMVQLISVTENTLSIEVEATDPNGRVTQIFGNYTFTFSKQ